MEEQIDIYNRNREKTGEIRPRKRAALQPGEFMLYALALIETPEGTYLITKRRSDKKWAADCWEIPGGGCRSGEDSRQGINREVREETGLDVSKEKPVSVYCYVNEDPESGDNYFCDIFHFRMDIKASDITLQEEESSDFALVPFEKINEIGSRKQFLHYERIKQALQAEAMLH